MSKSGLADSPFFMTPQKPLETTPPPAEQPSQKEAGTKIEKPKKQMVAKPKDYDPVTPQHPETRVSSNNANMQASVHASNNANMQALTEESITEIIRKAVKGVGKDSATYRFTPEEKKALLELGFSYKVQGYKTSENELVRIAINFILEDQKQNGRNSVLQKVLDALSK